jgi:uncharacterized caspase-like protein
VRSVIGFWIGEVLRAIAAAAIAFVFTAPVSAGTHSKVALVIGNGGYLQVPRLPNPTHDASDVADSLERLDFRVVRIIDGKFDDMRRALLDFGHAARGSEIAIIYYAGHGMEVAGENWLIPIDAVLNTDVDAENEAVSLRSATNAVSGATKLGLVILDACRNNPFAAKMQRTLRTRSIVSRGLGRVEPTGSVLVAYAAKDGTTAADGSGRNSPFTAALLRHIETPDLEVNFLFRQVRDDVMEATQDEQEPFVYGSLSRDPIFLVTLPPGSTITVTTPPPSPTTDEIAWNLVKDTANAELLRNFVRQYPNSRYRADAEQRIEKLANLPAPSVVHAPIEPAPKPSVKSAKPKSGSNCFTFNGRQVCE